MRRPRRELIRPAAAISVLVLCVAVAGCGSDDAASVVSSTPTIDDGPTTDVTIVDAAPNVDSVADLATIAYTIVAGDTLSGIARRHCSTVPVLVELNGWADGANHAIFPADVVVVPVAACDGAPTESGSDGGTTAEPEFSSPFGDPADYGAVYSSTECTELREAANDLKAGTGSTIEDPQPGERVRAAVAAMPDRPPAAEQDAIETAIAFYTRYAPVNQRAFVDSANGTPLSDNAAFRDLLDAFAAIQPDVTTMWAYIESTCAAA